MPCISNTASSDFADFITRYYTSPEEYIRTVGTDCIDFISNQFAVLHLPLSSVQELTFNTYTYASVPELYSLLDVTTMEAAGISQTSETPSLSNRGRGVLIGFIDTGIDYQNPLFQNPDGTSRILGIWDQTIDSEKEDLERNPSEMGSSIPETTFRPTYGTQYTKSRIDLALTSDNPLSIVPSTDTSGHGTALASIAAGGADEASGFLGAAPESYIGVVKLKPAKPYLRDFFLIQEDAEAFQENDIMLGITYLFSLAQQYKTPLVVCLGLGTNSGSHTGQSTLAQFINEMSRYNGTAFVVAAGNETGYDHHYRGTTTAMNTSDRIELKVGAETPGFSLEFWAQDIGVYSIGFLSPSGQFVPGAPARTDRPETYDFLLENTQITVYSRVTTTESASQMIFLRFQTPQPGIWTMIITSLTDLPGTFHLWLPTRTFIPDSIGFLRSDPDTIVTGPGNALHPITVSAYDHTRNSIYIHSSRGYSRSGQIKPDLAAPGVNVLAAGRRPGMYIRLTGTSAAAAHVAGAAAILLSWGILDGNEPYMNSDTIKTYLIRGADRNPSLPYPNREFGYGTLNLYQAFLRLRL